jgi:uncharacterized protein YjbI with pentapeptide repeats
MLAYHTAHGKARTHSANKTGAEVWNAWRKKLESCSSEEAEWLEILQPDLRSLDLHDVILTGIVLKHARLDSVDFFQARLDRADLSFAGLRFAKLRLASLRGANLTGVDLSGADLAGADLRDADLSDAYLIGTNFCGTDLVRTKFDRAEISGATFAAVDLSQTTGLERIDHAGPSSIGIDTIYRSQGRIPKIFLRGAGVPEIFIDNARSLIHTGAKFYSCFISYSSRDDEFAKGLHTDLQTAGVRCWFAPHDVQSGRKLHDQIDEAIGAHEKLLLILSRHSMVSDWVKTEISKARKREAREGAQVLFPITLVPFEAIRDWECFDSDTGKDSAREIREYFIPDFSNWKDHDSYQRAFERLLTDLRAASNGTTTALSG